MPRDVRTMLSRSVLPNSMVTESAPLLIDCVAGITIVVRKSCFVEDIVFSSAWLHNKIVSLGILVLMKLVCETKIQLEGELVTFTFRVDANVVVFEPSGDSPLGKLVNRSLDENIGTDVRV